MKPHQIMALLLCGVLLLAGCSDPVADNAADPGATAAPPPANTTPVPTPSRAGQETASDDPAKVKLALEAARTMTTWNPRQDFNRTAAEQRARHLMTPDRANHVIAPERPATGEEWLTAAEKNATSHPTVRLQRAHHAQDTIAVEATWHWVTPDGDTWATEERLIFYFTFTDTEPYKIRDYTSAAQ